MPLLNRRAFELAISTLILIILGILLLVAIVYALTGGFKTFKSSTQPFLDTTQSSSVKQACSLACQNTDKLVYCCKNYTIDTFQVKCSDSRLEVNCNLNCQDFNCNPSPETLTQQQCEQRGGSIIADPGDGSSYQNGCPQGKILLGNVPIGREGGICCK